MTRLLRYFTLLFLGLVFLAPPASAAARPTYVIAFVPVKWSGGLDAFDAEAQRQGEFFNTESSIGIYADVKFKFIHDRLDGVSLDDRWLVQTIVAFGLTREPADRYIGLTNGDLALDSDWNVVGWTTGPDSLGIVLEAGDIEVTAHELGHTFGLCDEYYFSAWDEQNREWHCPNPFPPGCPQVEIKFCEGLPAPDGSNSIMGPAGLAGPYSYNTPSLSHLQSAFEAMFASGDSPLEPTPAPPTPEPTPEPMPIAQAIVFSNPDLVRLEPNGSLQQLAPGPAFQPDWSPDGQWIAFASSQNGNLDLYLISASGGKLQRLTESPARDSHPTWLSDNRAVIFVSDVSGVSALYLLDITSKSVQLLADLPTPASWPAVSPDGATLAFSAAPTGDWELYQVALNPDGQPRPNTLVRLTNSPGPDVSPAWSPDSASLAFASARNGSLDLYALTTATPSAVALTSSPANEWAPRWLADGRLVYHAYDGSTLGLWMLDPSAGETILLASAAWPAVQP